MISETSFHQVVPAWLEWASDTDVSLGLEPAEAFQRAESLLAELRSGRASSEDWAPEAGQVEVLHALVALVCREGADPRASLRDIGLVFEFVSALPWPVEAFGGPQDLLATCAFQAWRTARRVAGYSRILSDAQDVAERLFSMPIADWRTQPRSLALLSPELLLCLWGTMWSLTESAPSMIREALELSYYLF